MPFPAPGPPRTKITETLEGEKVGVSLEGAESWGFEAGGGRAGMVGCGGVGYCSVGGGGKVARGGESVVGDWGCGSERRLLGPDGITALFRSFADAGLHH